MTLLNINDVEIDTSEMDDLIAYVLSNCGLHGSEILLARKPSGDIGELDAINFIKCMLHNLPEHASDKIKTASSDDELQDALGEVIDVLYEVKSLSTVKALFDRRMSELAHNSLVAKILMENNYCGHEILLNGDMAFTSMQWAKVVASQDDPTYHNKKTFKLLLNITADVNSGKIVVEPDGTVQNNHECRM